MQGSWEDLEKIQRILLVKLSAIGDVVLATPLATALRRHLPGARISWLVEDRTQAVLAHNPEVDEILVWHRPDRAGSGRARNRIARQNQWRFIQKLRGERFDVVIDAQGSLKSGILTWLTGASWRIGQAGWREGRRLFYTQVVPVPTEAWGLYAADRYLHLLQPLGIQEQGLHPRLEVGPAERDFVGKFRREQKVAEKIPLISLCPVSSPTYRTKLWIPSRWARLADHLQKENGCRVVWHGAASDLPLIGGIVREMRTRPLVAAGRTTLLEAAALIQQSTLCVAVETGLQHFAVAVGTPVVVLLGPTLNTPPEPHRAVRKTFPCQPCHRHPTCQYQEGVGACLAAITVEEVLSACREQLARKVSPGDDLQK